MKERRWHVLEKLIKKNQWVIGAELGVWKARTYDYLLRNCPDLTLIGVDLYEQLPENEGDGKEKYITETSGRVWDHEKYWKTVQELLIEFAPRAIFFKELTYTAANSVEDNTLDFVFIDADHSEEGVRNDIEAWAPKVKVGGSILGHDINWPTVKGVVENFDDKPYTTYSDNVWEIVK